MSPKHNGPPDAGNLAAHTEPATAETVAPADLTEPAASAASAASAAPAETPVPAASAAPGTPSNPDSAHPSRETIDRYLNDLQTISGLMRRYDERAIVDHWAYVVWGALVIIGTAINWRWADALRTAGLDALVVIWLPILFLGSATEIFAIHGKTRAEGISLFTRRMKRFVATSLGIVAILALVVVHLDRTGFTAGILLALGATPLLFYAQETYAELFIEAFLLVLAGLIVTVLDVNSLVLRGAAGLAVGAVYIVSGVHSRNRERRASGGDQPNAAPRASGETHGTQRAQNAQGTAGAQGAEET